MSCSVMATNGSYSVALSSFTTVVPAIWLKNACFSLKGYTFDESKPSASRMSELISASVFASYSGSVTLE